MRFHAYSRTGSREPLIECIELGAAFCSNRKMQSVTRAQSQFLAVGKSRGRPEVRRRNGQDMEHVARKSGESGKRFGTRFLGYLLGAQLYRKCRRKLRYDPITYGQILRRLFAQPPLSPIRMDLSDE